MEWIDKLDGNVIVSDAQGTIIYMNEKAPDCMMNPAVKLFLLQQAANLGGSAVTWKNVLEIKPLPWVLSPELTMYNP
jgi:hypothetical protein